MRDLARIVDPREIESSQRLVHGALILSGLALADLVDARFRWIAYGAAGWLAASAFSKKSVSDLEHERHGLSPEEISACESNDLYVGPQRNGHSTGFGVPHRIPVEAMLVSERRAVEVWDDKPAPSVDGDLGLAD